MESPVLDLTIYCKKGKREGATASPRLSMFAVVIRLAQRQQKKLRLKPCFVS
jgi:hypothetical protein